MLLCYYSLTSHLHCITDTADLKRKLKTVIYTSVRPMTLIVAACNAETYHLLYVFVGHSGKKIDEVWQRDRRNGIKFCR